MGIRAKLNQGFLYMDGAMGSMLQHHGLSSGELPETWNLSHPQMIRQIHETYLQSGCDVITANTFGANGLKYGQDGLPPVNEVVRAGVELARSAIDHCSSGKERYVALDIGPTGHLLQPLGDLDFERAVEIYGEVVRAGTDAGANLVLIETMTDCYETKAAVLAAKENSDLPIFVTNIYDESSRLMTGATPEAMVAMLEGLRVDALGLNCGLGPKQMLPIAKRITACASIPVIVQPNAGLPHLENGQTIYDVTAEQFADDMVRMAEAGAQILGGCCGTRPEHIRQMIRRASTCTFFPARDRERTVVTSFSQAVVFGERPVQIGEKINPNGKEEIRDALERDDIDAILDAAQAQADGGADIIDVNVGLPGSDEAETMCRVIRAVQEICGTPLQIDSSDPAVLKRAMRMYNGKPMVNSVNGKEESMRAVFPLVAKYGGVVVGLTLDERGIPQTAEERTEIAENICRTAEQYGIQKKDIIIDPLAMTISSDPNAAQITLDSVQRIREKLGVRTSLGVSNISFGLPGRAMLNAAFYTAALERGLDAAILDPLAGETVSALRAHCALHGMDANCGEWIRYAADAESQIEKEQTKTGEDALYRAVLHGLKKQASAESERLVQTQNALSVINSQVIPALDAVGKGFENGRIFLPQLLMTAEAAKASFDILKKGIRKEMETSGYPVVLATVKGDIHDIGKNIVKVLLESYHYEVIDLGRDVEPERILKAVHEHKAPLVGLSALMTTTVPAMEETICLLHAKAPGVSVAVGGAVLTQGYADQIGADQYCADAMETVRYANQIKGQK